MNYVDLRAERQRLERLYLLSSRGVKPPTFCDVQRALMQLERSHERGSLNPVDAATLRRAFQHPLGRDGIPHLNAAESRGRLLQHEVLACRQILIFLLEVV